MNSSYKSIERKANHTGSEIDMIVNMVAEVSGSFALIASVFLGKQESRSLAEMGEGEDKLEI